MRTGLVIAALLSAGCAAGGSHEWESLFDGKSLAGWEKVEFGGDGEVTVKDGNLVIGSGARLTGLRAMHAPQGPAYEVELEAMRVDGHDFFCGLTFPVKSSSASLIVGGWGGGVCGISSLNGQDASENETTKAKEFEKGRWYKVRLRVKPDSIEAWINGEVLVDVDITEYRVSTRGDIRECEPFGLASYQTTAALRGIRWKRISPDEQ